MSSSCHVVRYKIEMVNYISHIDNSVVEKVNSENFL